MKRIMLRPLSLFLIFSLLLTGCSALKPPSPPPTAPSTAVPSATAMSMPSPTPKASSTPAASPTPVPPHEPRLLSRLPERGQEQLVDAPIVLQFDQAMDRASVEQAFAIAPAVEGAFSWPDAQTLQFRPGASGFARDATYRVTIGTGARSAVGLALAEPIEFSFRTVGYLEVAGAFPAPDSEDVETTSAIRVVFNRPVVPLTGIAEQANLAPAFTITPTVEGKGEWINTATYSFQPTKGLRPATIYRVRVPAGLADATGGVLAEDYTWSFTTQRPAVVSVEPADGAKYASPKAGVRVTFNTAMDRADVQKRFRLSKEGQGPAVSGQFTWVENTLVFTPTASLEPGATYRAEVQAGALAEDGQTSLASAVIWQFTVAPIPKVLSVTPRAGATNVEPGKPVEIRFNSPMDPVAFREFITITPSADIWPWFDEEDTLARFYAYLRPSTRYTVTISAGAPGRYGDKLAEGKVWSFRTAPYPPSVSLQTPGPIGLYNSNAPTRLYIAYRNISKINLRLYALTPKEVIAINSPDGWPDFGKTGKLETLVRSWSIPAQAPQDVQKFISVTLTTEAGKPLPSGFYYLAATAPEVGREEGHLLVVSPYNLALKSTEREALVWATDLRTGQGVEGIDLEFYGQDGRLLSRATTDTQGIARTEFLQQESWSPLMVVGSDGTNIAAVFRGWNDGISPWEYGLEMTWGQPPIRAHLFTERQIYRPGQTVYLKGIVRLDDDGRYTLPREGQTVRLSAMDASGREFWQKTVSLSAVGSFDTEILLAESAPLGQYAVTAVMEGAEKQPFETYFQVAEYRKPEFQVSVTLDKGDYVQGDKIRATVEASYFFGGPVQDATVQWRVLRSPYYFDRWQGEGWYSFQDFPDEPPYDFGGFVTEGTGKTDALGQFTFEVPADISQQKQSQLYTLEASVIDVNNQEVSARAGAVIHKGTFYIGLRSEQYVGTVGQKLTVQAITVDTQGLTRTQQALTVTFYKQEWYSVKEKASDGSENYYWTNKIRQTAVATQTVKTDARGMAWATFTPKEGGTYKVVATGLDEYENEVRSSLYLWVSSGTEYINWGQENHDRITLVADKKSYRPGETAKVMVPSPYQGQVNALLTIERGKVIQYQVITLKTNSDILEIPIREEYAPNIFVSVLLVQGAPSASQVPSFKLGYVMLPVSTERQQLKVTITPDKAIYRPRDTATYEISTQTYDGKGVPAEVTLQLVDLAVEKLTGASRPNIVDTFYRQRGLNVWTSASLVKLVERVNISVAREGKGGGGGAEGMVREVFPDVAFWAPSVQTDASGKAKVTVTLPDNLTTWRMTAQAVTADTRVGQATADVITNLDLMIRPMVPRFAVIGDQPTLGAVVHNNTDKPLDVAVSLTAEGMRIQDGARQVHIAAGGRERLYWPASVVATYEATLRFEAKAGALSDAVLLRVPVYYPASAETVGTSGQVEGRVTEWVRLPENAEPTLGELSVTLEPSLAAGMQEGLRYLEAYPYDCIEQTVSRFLPNVLTYRALKALGLEKPQLATRLPQQVGVGLQRLYALQNLDGGWGWWPNEASHPSLTAYVLLGLVEARRADFAVDSRTIDLAVAFLQQWLEFAKGDDSASRDERAFVLYALAEAGQGDMGRTVLLYDKRADMSLYAKAYLAMTLNILDPQGTTRLTTLSNELINAAQLSATGAYWQEKLRAKWAMNTDTRTTAIILRALVQIAPKNPLLPQVVRWLMTARSTGRWETTQENVWAIWALTDYMVATGEFQADYAYELSVNDVNWAKGRVTKETLDEPVLVRVPVGRLLFGADNAVTMAREGTGRMYYSAFLRYYLPAEELQPLGRGVYIQREYALASDPTKPVTSAKVNDILTVKLTLIAPTDLYYLVIEDPLPAGCEALDTSLATTRTVEESQGLVNVEAKGKGPWWWGLWPSHAELRDEKVALFVTQLARGAYEYTYQVRCTTPGEFKVLPATAFEMYEPDVFGRSAGSAFQIGE